MLRLLRQALQTDRLEVAWELRLQARRRDRVVVEGLEAGVHDGGGLERRAAGQQLVEDGPEGVHVCRRANGVSGTSGLLGGHVARCAEDSAALSQVRLGGLLLSEAEVGDLQ